MNKKGQALIEFVLILPIFIFLLLAIYDIAMIFNKKNSLENKSTDIVELSKAGKPLEEINNLYPDLTISINQSNEYNEFLIGTNLKLYTPGFNRIFGNPYKITVKRYIPNE